MSETVTVGINDCYLSENFLTCWSARKESVGEEAYQNYYEPFHCLALPNFLVAKNAEDNAAPETTEKVTKSFLTKLREEITDNLDFEERNNDLYKFYQSPDLKNCDPADFPWICKIREFFYGPGREWMSKFTGIELRGDYVALGASAYYYTDYLLCHDDELEERRIAFVLYLTQDWKLSDGGTLDLFESDVNGQPRKVAHQILPKCNTLSMFEVGEESFHQISEVVKDSTPRLSINGWYHGAPLPRSLSTHQETSSERVKPDFVSYETLVSWISPVYLDEKVQKEIREKFENDSEIELQNFLQDEKYQAVLSELLAPETKFRDKIVPNKRWYHWISQTDLKEDSKISICSRLFQSEAVFLLLSQLTGLPLHTLYKEEPTDDDSAEKSEPKTPERSGGSSEVESGSTPVVVVSQAPGSPDSALKRRRTASPSCEDRERGKKEPRVEETILNTVEEANGENQYEEVRSSCCLEFRKFTQGCYTLMHDEVINKREGEEDDSGDVGEDSDVDEKGYCLDAQLFFTTDEWHPKHGGYTCYVAKGEDEELLTVTPKGNSLALVYRDPGSLKFVKYVNHSVVKEFQEPGFCDLNAAYFCQ